MEETDSYK